MWSVVEPAGDPCRIEILGQSAAPERVEFRFDPAAQRLACAIDRPPREVRWSFEVASDGTTLRRRSRVYSVEQAVDAVLDELVTTCS
jgi:hypothetical protein